MQQSGIEEHCLFLFESADNRRRSSLYVNAFQLVSDRIKPGERGPIVVFIVALNQARRDAVQSPGTDVQWSDAVFHGLPSEQRGGPGFLHSALSGISA